ncbi:MAG: PqqD family protein [Pyrinomonadaceae bacterium]
MSSQATPHDHIVFTEFDDSEGIVVDLNTKKYYQLNETATLIWKGIASGAPIVEIANNLVDSYEVTPEDAQRNVKAVVQQLQDYKLIKTD